MTGVQTCALPISAAGVLTGIAVLIKQSAFDAGLAALVYLLWRERRRGLAPAAVLVASALVPVAIAAASAARLSAWLYAVFGYRFEGDSLLTGSLSGRAHQFWLSLPPAGKALGLLAVLTAVGWRRFRPCSRSSASAPTSKAVSAPGRVTDCC